jgi:phosphoenolpyruvate synthase/pyruvate phosphate dikinase
LSANPLTGNCDEVVINAKWGLGASLVGGAVTPAIYIRYGHSGQIRDGATAIS